MSPHPWQSTAEIPHSSNHLMMRPPFRHSRTAKRFLACSLLGSPCPKSIGRIVPGGCSSVQRSYAFAWVVRDHNSISGTSSTIRSCKWMRYGVSELQTMATRGLGEWSLIESPNPFVDELLKTFRTFVLRLNSLIRR